MWLDLGAVQSGLLLRLQHRRARLIVADLPAAQVDAAKLWYLPESLLAPDRWDRPVDRVLVWDLLDYLDAEKMRQLTDQLADHLAPQCCIHALIHYSSPGMPAQPGGWRFDHAGALHSTTRTDKTLPAPRYSPKALEKAMPRLRVERTVLLNNGMQEFILTLRD